MKIIFRTSSDKNKKFKNRLNFTPLDCLKNLKKNFRDTDITLVGDFLTDTEIKNYEKVIGKKNLILINFKNNAKSFLFCINLALGIEKSDNFKIIKNENEIIYFVENDYIHLPESKKNLIDAFNLNAHYVSLYDHPDSYNNINSLVDFHQSLDNANKKVLLGRYRHWITARSTTCTFAVKKKTLLQDYIFFKKGCKRDIPRDYKIFSQLTGKGRILITALPALSTHNETLFLSPLINWKKEIK
jgi:hypothetical protein